MNERLMISGKRLSSLRVQHYLTQEELANRLGMSIAGVRRLEQMPVAGMHLRNFRKLAEIFEMSYSQLREKIGVRSDLSASGSSSADNSPVAALVQPTAVASALPVSAVERFVGVSASRREDRSDQRRSPVFLPSSGERRFAVTVDGDCMEPQYGHGDVVIFSVDAVEREGIRPGRNYFIQFTDGQTTFKRIFPHPLESQQLLLRCWNQKYPDRAVDRSEIQLLARAIYRLVEDEAESSGGKLNSEC